MESALERLATEMMKLPANEWARFVELCHAGQQQQVRYWPAEEGELTERLANREPRRQPCTGYGSTGRLHARLRVVAKGIE